MILDYKTYRDKVIGCWAGKNIGGVLGAPFEAKRQVNDVDFYIQDLTKGPPPNDDLDLQIVWLAAVERYGRNVNASILGDYWLSYIIPNWSEYGMGKANLRAGLEPPLSGLIDNVYKDSCGCFIRSEIWACLAPGQPQLAARYAYEDAIVDHEGEGMYGEIFCAALQSAAFVESDSMKLIEIGLSYIPPQSAMARCIKKAVECHKGKVPFLEARKRIHNEAPGTFGLLQGTKLNEIKKEGNEGLEIGKPGFDAPENVGFTIAGFLYGEGDFGKSLCLANSCGEDTDCTCATLGALMGIISGAVKLPEKWTKPLDDKIVTLCIDKTSAGVWVPDTATQLAERVIRAVPGFLGQDLCDIFAPGGMTIKCLEGDDLFCKNSAEEYLPLMSIRTEELPVAKLTALSPYVTRHNFTAFSIMVDYNNSVFFNSADERTIKVTVINSLSMRQQQWAKITLYAPDGISVINGASVQKTLNNLFDSKAEAEFTFNAAGFKGAKLELIVDVSLEGRHSCGQARVVLMRENKATPCC